MSSPASPRRVAFHLRFGWWSLLLFLTLGLVLEAMHGFKVGWYLDVENEVRRLMFTLAHAHGVLLALVHLGWAATLHVSRPIGRAPVLASRGLVAASVLLPIGFLLGAFGTHGGDPGVGIGLVPLGAAALFAAVLGAALSVRVPPAGSAPASAAPTTPTEPR